MNSSKHFYKFFILIIVLLIPFCISKCLKEKVESRPCNQPFSKWMSEDGTISFEVNEKGAGYGTLTTADGIIDIYFATGSAKLIHIYRIIDGEHYELIEWWNGDFNESYKFTAVVSQPTTYYKKGQKITFYRINEKLGTTL